MSHPLTPEEAKDIRYGRSGEHAYIEGKCAYATDTAQRWQCIRSNGFGPGGLYCWQHASMIKRGLS